MEVSIRVFELYLADAGEVFTHTCHTELRRLFLFFFFLLFYRSRISSTTTLVPFTISNVAMMEVD